MIEPTSSLPTHWPGRHLAMQSDSVDSLLRLVGPERALEIFGIRLVGFSAENGKKLLLTLVLASLIVILTRLLRWISYRTLGKRSEQAAFWGRQVVQIGMAILLILGLASIWFNDPGRLATALALITAGLAFALQKVVTALAGYFVILRGKTFNVGDRITMGGVRGDAIALGLIQTTIMEMGQPPDVQEADPAIWVQSRQYTGRIVTVSNARIFDEPVYNYTLDFPFLWEEMAIAIAYNADRRRAEEIILAAARRHTTSYRSLGEAALREMQRRYFMKPTELEPRVYYRLTNNWLELTARFITEDHGIRELKDKMSRDILQAFDEAGIPIASATFEIVGLPPLRIEAPAQGQGGTGGSPP